MNGEDPSCISILPMGFSIILVQLLWVNLVTDGPPPTPFGYPADIDIMKKPPRKSDDALINSWIFFRYMVIGSYVRIATVAVFILWCSYDYLFKSLRLLHYRQSKGNDAITLRLVAIEMFIFLNDLLEDNNLLKMPPWKNPWLLVSMFISFSLHCLIMYIPFLANVFGNVPAGVFSEHKYEIVKILQQKKHVCGMTGDGVNDAPALKKADIGIDVVNATDAVRSASDIVLTELDLSVIISDVLTSRAIFFCRSRLCNADIYVLDS